MKRITDDVIARIDQKYLVDFALELANIDSATTHEATVAEHIYQWMVRAGFRARKVGLLKDRFNVMGVLEGTGGGYSLLFNSHMDTHIPREPDWVHLDVNAPENHSSWRDGDYLYGEGVANDKGLMAAFLVAGKAIKESGHKLKGDLVLTGVSSESSHEPVDDAPGVVVESKDLGARFLAIHGGIADYALIAEGTGWGVIWAEPGEYWYKVTIRSNQPPFYTPYLPERTRMVDSPNMIVAAAAAVEALERWAADYQKRNTVKLPGGTIVPKAQIGGIRGGDPHRPILAPQLAALYMDVRAAPGQDPLRLGEEIRTVLTDIGLDASVELYSFRRGYEAKNIDRLAESVKRSHIATFGKAPEPALADFSSLWRDINIYNEIGIPALTYGPRAATHAFRRSLTVEQLYQTACVYARIAVDLCSQEKC